MVVVHVNILNSSRSTPKYRGGLLASTKRQFGEILIGRDRWHLGAVLTIIVCCASTKVWTLLNAPSTTTHGFGANKSNNQQHPMRHYIYRWMCWHRYGCSCSVDVMARWMEWPSGRNSILDALVRARTFNEILHPSTEGCRCWNWDLEKSKGTWRGVSLLYGPSCYPAREKGGSWEWLNRMEWRLRHRAN